MIRSMTGFGSAEAVENGVSFSIEVQSVNGRFLDLKVKLPKCFYEYEGELRKIVQGYVERGRIHLNVTMNVAGTRASAVKLDYELAERYVTLARELAARHGIQNNMDSRTLLSMPDILAGEEAAGSDESHWEMTKKAVIEALEAHRAMREKEGAAIGQDISSRLEAISRHIDTIEARAPEIIKANTARLRKRIEVLLAGDTLDEARLAMEVAVYADRLDITEECVRFRSHNQLFAQEISQKKTSGRKLSFLLQEMNREANTIGSKVMDADVTGVVVLIKEELEKMREQAENME